MTTTWKIVKRWTSGDRVYGAVNASAYYPASTHHAVICGRELPVAEILHVGDLGYRVVRWIPRSEPFPAPIVGYNPEAAYGIF